MGGLHIPNADGRYYFLRENLFGQTFVVVNG